MLLQIALFHYFIWSSSILLYVYLCVCVYYIFFSHSSADGHLGCLHVLAIVNSAAMNLLMDVSFFEL